MPQHTVFRGKNKRVCFDRIQAESWFPQFKQLNYMVVSPDNENRQTTFNRRQTTFSSPENHEPAFTALFQ